MNYKKKYKINSNLPGKERIRSFPGRLKIPRASLFFPEISGKIWGFRSGQCSYWKLLTQLAGFIFVVNREFAGPEVDRSRSLMYCCLQPRQVRSDQSVRKLQNFPKNFFPSSSGVDAE